MNNEFKKEQEKNLNEIPDTETSEKSTDNEVIDLSDKSIYEDVTEPEQTTAVNEAEDISSANDSVELNEAEENPTDEAPAENQEPVSEIKEKVSCIPGSETYIYNKETADNNQVIGCVWENNVKVPKKKKTGFKVFTAAMLCVFTLSAATIAGCLVYDYVKETASSNNPTVESSTVVNHTINPNMSLVSTFAENKTGLTKTQVAAKCSPSSVGIVVEGESNFSSSFSSIPFFFEIPNTTQIVMGYGSGFILNTDGYIITNHHVIENAKTITVHFHDGATATATLVGSDALTDIAVLKVDTTGLMLVPMELGNSDLMQVGDDVIAIGCPAGIEFMGTVTDGIISAINRNVSLQNDNSSTKKTMTLIQTNATINKGNSGGPLINSMGQVIGINTLKLSAGYEGIGFSIPINGALPIINQLIEHGEVIERNDNSFVSSEGVIGISASEITKEEAEYYDIPLGVLVVQIDKDSNAATAGLRRGDIITEFNGTTVKTVTQLNNLKAKFKAGDEVTLTVFRESINEEGSTFKITFKLNSAE